MKSGKNKRTRKRASANNIDPRQVASDFLNCHFFHADGCTLKLFRGMPWSWHNNRWRQIPDKELKAEILRYLGDRFNNTSSATAHIVKEFVWALVTIDGTTPMPCWQDNRAGFSLAFSNGIVTLEHLISQQPDCLLPHSPAWFSPICLPYDYRPDATCPKWLAMLDKSLESDRQRLDLLQEFAGYCLQHSTDHHKMLLLTGDGGNGKSCVLAGITGMLGQDNVSSLTLDELSQKFMRPRILGKLANICADMESVSQTCEGTLKKLISGDPLEFERKYQEPFCAVSTAKLMCSTNTLPLFVDRSSGIWRRLLIMPFNRPVTTEEKINGMDKSDYWLNQGELPGIFMWALSGLRRLQRQGAFSESVVCNDAIAEHRAECNPTADWLLDTYTKSDGGTIEKTQMFKNYFEFFKQSNEKPLTRSAFFKEVRRVFKGVKEQRGERKGTDRRRLIIGISRID